MADVKTKMGRRIRNLRRLKDWTQEELGERASLSGKYIGEIERGVANVTIDAIESIVKALEIDLPDLFEISHEVDRDHLLAEIKKNLDKADDETVQLIFRIIKSVLY